MKTFIWTVIACLATISVAHAQAVISLEITGSWTAADYDVSSTGPTSGALGIPEENDDLVFGTSPSDGSTTFTLLVDTAGAQFIPAGTLGVTHDWYGYTNVSLVGTHTFGSASWVSNDILTALNGPGGATATLWTNTDISLASPTLLSFRMFGTWEGNDADLFVGPRTATTIGTQFLLWEYYGGEEIRSWSYAATSIVPVEIDIKPGSDPNTINCLGKQGIIPVALLTTNTFDALTVDHTTVSFGRSEASVIQNLKTPALGTDGRRPGVGPVMKRHEEDVDGDGDLDLVFHFARDEAGIRCGDTEATLTGETYDGQRFLGTDAIRTAPVGLVPGKAIEISPNPFNPATNISFFTESPQRVKVGVYDVRGRLLTLLADQSYPAGRHTVQWLGRDTAGRSVPSGIYFFRVELGERTVVRKAMLMK